MTVPDRIRCEAIGCKRTAAKSGYPAGTIIICGKCSRMANRSTRAAWREARKAVIAAEARATEFVQGWPVFADADAHAEFDASRIEEKRLWAGFLAEINEARGGIA